VNEEGNTRQLIEIPLEINGQQVLGLLDTGANRSVMSKDLAKRLKLVERTSNQQVQLNFAANNSSSNIISTKITTKVTFEEATFSIDFIPVDNIRKDLILALDFMAKFGIIITCREDEIKVESKKRKINVFIAQTIVVPPLSASLVEVTTPEVQNGDVMCEPLKLPKHVTAPNLLRVVNHHSLMYIKNTSHVPLTVHEGSRVGKIEFDRAPRLLQLQKENTEFPNFDSADINKQIDEKFQKKMRTLLHEYADLFPTSLKQLTTTNLGKHHIDLLPGALPPPPKCYRINDTDKDMIREQIDEMVACDIIVEKDSDFVSPVIIVRKRDGTPRLCIDYRMLNKIIAPLNMPIPSISETIDRLAGSKFFTTLDLFAGFHQVAMDEESQHFTGFACLNSVYQFKVTPFGLKSSPARFVALVTKSLKGLTGKNAEVYVDDVIVHSATLDDHIIHVKQVFDALQKANFKLKLSKCSFAQTSIAYLGFQIDANGYQPDPTRTVAVQDFPQPLTATEVRSFLGLANFYRTFVPNFAKRAQVLNALLRKDVLFEWTAECQKAFEDLRDSLVSPPALRHFNPKLPISLECDASGKAIGCVINQFEDNIPHAVSYYSRSLSPCEQRYSVYEQEAVAILDGIRKHRHYLYGRHFDVITDHHSLCYVWGKKSQNARITRMKMALSDYDFTIHYRKGCENTVADCLSRRRFEPTFSLDNDELDNLFFTEQVDLSKVSLRKHQGDDEFCASIILKLENRDLKTWREGFTINNNVLIKEIHTEAGKRSLICIPKKLLGAVLFLCHDVAFVSAHFGYTKTLARVRACVFRPKLARDVRRYCATCKTCQLKKHSTRPESGPQQPNISSSRLFSTWSLDYAGPYNEGENGEKYILLAVDHASRLVEALATRDATAKTTARFLINNIFFRYSPPEILLTDNGVHFRADVIAEINKILKIEHRFTSIYNPRANGLCERLVGVIKQLLKTYVPDNGHWPLYLQAVVYAYNCSVSATLKRSPYQLVFMAEPRTIVDLTFGSDPGPARITELMTKAQEIRNETEEKVLARQKETADYRNKSLREQSFEEGQLVKIKRKMLDAACRAWRYTYAGPFLVLKKLTEVSYRVRDLRKTTKKRFEILRVHVRDIEEFNHREDDLITKKNVEEETYDAQSNETEDWMTQILLDDDVTSSSVEEVIPQTSDTQVPEHTAEEGDGCAQASLDHTCEETPAEQAADASLETGLEPVLSESSTSQYELALNGGEIQSSSSSEPAEEVITRAGRVSRAPQRYGD
jgi:transposase InsO family protein